MVVAEVRTPFFNEERGQVDWRLLALVRAEGDELHVEAVSPEVFDAEMAVVDLATGRTLVARDDPEVWARNLPHAFRAGDIVISIITDSNPVEAVAEAPVPDEELPRIPPATARRADGAASVA